VTISGIPGFDGGIVTVAVGTTGVSDAIASWEIFPLNVADGTDGLVAFISYVAVSLGVDSAIPELPAVSVAWDDTGRGPRFPILNSIINPPIQKLVIITKLAKKMNGWLLMYPDNFSLSIDTYL
jgi:hypothetical protein